MKKTVLLLAFILCYGGSVFSQVASKAKNDSPRFYYNIQAGCNVSSLLGTGSNWRSTTRPLAMLMVGNMFEHVFQNKWGIEYGFLYDGKGVSYSGSEGGLKLEMHCVSFPVLYKRYFKSFNVDLGVKGTWIVATNSIKKKKPTLDSDLDESALKSGDVGLVAGVGYNLFSRWVTVFAQYEMGLVNLARNDFRQTGIGHDMGGRLRNSTFTFGLKLNIDVRMLPNLSSNYGQRHGHGHKHGHRR